MSKTGFDFLLSQLDRFIRKYYLNAVIRGGIYFAATTLGLFLLINLVEYQLYLSTTGRKVLFFGFLLLSFASLFNWVLTPLFKMFSLGKRISREEAAQIIGSHFEDVKDKLLNLLQLGGQLDDATKELVLASIDQRSRELKPIPILKAIDLSVNRRYLKFLAFPLAALVIILFAAPNLIPDASLRLLRNDTYFEPDMPFTFEFQDENLSVVEGEDFTLNLRIKKQTALPSDVFVVANGYRYKMSKDDAESFSYRFNQVKTDIAFHFEAEGYSSRDAVVNVLLKPVLNSFEVALGYPDHTGLEDATRTNVGDLQVPEGTRLAWNINTANTETLFFLLGDSATEAERLSKQVFSFREIAFESFNYSIVTQGTNKGLNDTVNYAVSVVKDMYPEISVDQFADSLNDKYLYFLGEVSDDYGLKNLQFVYQRTGSDSGSQRPVIEYLPLSSGSIYDQFNHFFDVSVLGLRPGESVNYYFQVCDNDAFNGSKCSKSRTMVYKMPSVEEFEASTENSNTEIKDKLKNSIESSKELQEEVNALKERLLENKNMTWEDKQAIEKVLNQQKNLEQQVESIQNEMQKNFDQQKEYKEPNAELLQKQEMLEDLFDSVFDEEMKELMEKLENMLDEAMKDQMMEELEEMEMSDEEIEKELDRMLELFKNLEFQQKLEEVKSEMEDLAEKQEQLAEESEKKGADNDALKEEQDKLNEEFEKLAKEMEKLEEMNKELSKPQDGMEEMNEKTDGVKSDQQNASDQLGEKNNKKASESQKSAAEQMKEMASQMASMMSSMQGDQHFEDMEALRQLLENLVTLSFEQEQLMDEFKKTDINSPKYVSLVQDQFKIKDDSKMVEDSLYALAGRVFEIQSFVTEQITDVNREMEKAIDYLEERKTPKATVSQQFVMTGYNNLALMLSEVLDNMQQAASSSMQGSQNCQNPGQKKGPGDQLGNLGQMQKQLNDQINQLSEMMKNGKMPGGKGGMSKQLAQMAAKQAAIREALQKLNENQNSDGTNSLGQLEELMEQMDKTETDLVNKQLTEEMLKRQQEITVKLLEAAEAEKQREKDKKRESNVAPIVERKAPPSLEEYLKSRDAEIELYRTVPADLKPYYKGLVEKYFKSISFSER